MRSLAWAALAAACIAGPAGAVTLTPGSNPLPGTTEAARPELAGVVLQDRLVNYSVLYQDALFQGQVQERVVREDGAGTLDFYWRVIPTDTDGRRALPLYSLRLGGFGDFITDGDWRIDGLGVQGPATAYVFGGSSGEVNFSFDPPMPGTDTDGTNFFFLHTDARVYADTGALDVTCNATASCSSGVMSTFAPTAAPEPASWAMMLTGFFGLGALIRRNRAAPPVAAAA